MILHGEFYRYLAYEAFVAVLRGSAYILLEEVRKYTEAWLRKCVYIRSVPTNSRQTLILHFSLQESRLNIGNQEWKFRVSAVGR